MAEDTSLAEILRARSTKVSEEEFERRTEDYRGYDYMVEDGDPEDGFVSWNAVDKARETPRPLLFRDRIGECGKWESWIGHPRLMGKTWIVFGGGSSALDLPLSLLDGEIVYGLNWTRKWFPATFLQIIDPPVMTSQVTDPGVESWEQEGTQLVTSTRCAVDCLTDLKNDYESLNFKVHHATQVDKQHEIHLPDSPDERTTWYSNSLGYALCVASWFKPSRIVLLGLDFGGAHFFGDGRSEGAHCHYGMGGSQKPHLRRKLEVTRDWVQSKGIPIYQVGKTNLDLFWHCETLEQALYY